MRKVFMAGVAWTVCMIFSLSACTDERPIPASEDERASTQKEFSSKNFDPAIVRLVEQIDIIRQDYGVAAVGLTIVNDEKVLFAGANGVMDWQSKNPVNQHTGFRLGSITKTFTGLTALRLQRATPNLLTQNIHVLKPGLLDDRFSNDAITLGMLLEHTAGLSDLAKAEFDVQDGDIRYSDAFNVHPPTRQLRWPPGAHSSYSNAGYGFAGFMLQEIAGQPFETLMRKQVLQPLGMHNTGFRIDQSGPQLAQGYDRDGRTEIPYWEMIYRSFGALDTTPADMAIFLQALLRSSSSSDGDNQDRQRLFESAEERLRFENPATTLAARAGLDYGYGLGNYHWFAKGARFHGHGGDADGYLSHFAYQTDAKLAYFVVITAFNHAPLRKMRAVLEDYIASQVDSDDASPATLKPSQLARWEGNYEAVTQRFVSTNRAKKTIQVRLRGGRLETVNDNDATPLVAVSEYLFRRPWQPQASYAFIEDDDGHVYLQGDIGNFRRLKK